MERAVALKKVAKLLGKPALYRIDDNAPSSEERQAAMAELPGAVAERDRLKADREARMNALLAADEEYQALKVAAKSASERAMRLSSMRHRYKITVGYSSMGGLAFSIMGEGDSWEEVIDKLSKKKQVA